MKLIITTLVPLANGHYNHPISFMIGDKAPSGGVHLYEDFQTSPLDLAVECGPTSECPTVLIFAGDQQKTVNVINCKVGQIYFFINRSKHDMGLDIQQQGGMFGSKSMSRFDIATCACLPNDEEEQEKGQVSGGALFCR